MRHLFDRAFHSQFGVEIKTDNRQLLRQKLYAERRRHYMYDNISIVFPSDETRVWLMKKEPDDDPS